MAEAAEVAQSRVHWFANVYLRGGSALAFAANLVGGATVAAVAAAAGALTYAALSPGSQMFGRTVIAGNDPGEVALTYDDGPNDAATDALLDVLALHGARATFFMIGRFVRERHALVRRVQAAGHLIGNHTETHPWLAWQTDERIREEMQHCQHALEDVLGEPVKHFRPPHGARRPAVFRAAEDLELKIVQWNVMGYDWEPIGAERILGRVGKGLARARRKGVGANILLHDGGDRAMGADRSATVAVTAALLQRWESEGVKAVTVDAWG